MCELKRTVTIRKTSNFLRRGRPIGATVRYVIRGEYATDDDSARRRAWALWRRELGGNENQMDWTSEVTPNA